MIAFRSLLFIATIIPVCLSANCTLCPDGSMPADPGAKLMLNEGKVLLCSTAHELAPQGYFDNCTELHTRAADICGCGKKPDEKCSLCQNGALPDPGKIIARKNCSDWEQTAAKGFAQDCFSWQQTFGNFCGCENSKLESFCNICDKELPFIEKLVKFSDNTEKTCIQIEREENAKIATKQTNCTTEQSRYLNVCDCNPQPTPAPFRRTSSSTIQTFNIYGFVFFVTSTFCLKLV